MFSLEQTGVFLFLLIPACSGLVVSNNILNQIAQGFPQGNIKFVPLGAGVNSMQPESNEIPPLVHRSRQYKKMTGDTVEYEVFLTDPPTTDNGPDYTPSPDEAHETSEVPEDTATDTEGSTAVPASDVTVTCRDEAGQPVDWWILYKLPVPEKHRGGSADQSTPDSFIAQGAAYTYILASDKEQSWTLSAKSINDDESLPGQTLAAIYQSNADMLTLLYNDEIPDGPTSFNMGHTKGAVFGDSSNGVWLIHSVPHFPPHPNQTYAYPSTGHRYGQSFICLSLQTSTLENVGRQLLYNEPFLYGVHLPAWVQGNGFSSLQRAASGLSIKSAPYYNEEKLSTAGGVALISFAKFRKFGKDLYSDLVAPGLQISLLVETWPNGPGRMPSNCSSQFKVENVQEMDFPGIEWEDFTTKHDHAKWAISLDESKPYVCIGDINRMNTQTKRGGGTTCLENPLVWASFKSAIKAVEPCPAHPTKKNRKKSKKYQH